MAEIMAIGFVGFSVGLYVGVKLASIRWRMNAKDYRRMEVGGKLYKVLSSEDWDKVAQYVSY